MVTTTYLLGARRGHPVWRGYTLATSTDNDIIPLFQVMDTDSPTLQGLWQQRVRARYQIPVLSMW